MKLAAWSGLASIVIVGTGFVVADFIPPPHPSWTAAHIAALYRHHATGIRLGMILVMFGATLLMPFTAIVAIQMRRIEGRYPVLALCEFGSGALFVLEFIYLAFFWVTGAYRSDRPGAIVQTLNDMGWIPFIGLSATAIMQSVTFGIAILSDRTQGLFPRWLGYFNLWVPFIWIPGTFCMFFYRGPLAWDGFIAFWVGASTFASWMIINPICVARSIDPAGVHDLGDDRAHVAVTNALHVELTAIRAELARLALNDK